MLLKVVRAPFGWRIVAQKRIFEGPTVERVTAKAREVFPDAIFLVYFFGPKPVRRRRRYPTEVA